MIFQQITLFFHGITFRILKTLKKYKINSFFIENTFLPNLGGRYFLV